MTPLEYLVGDEESYQAEFGTLELVTTSDYQETNVEAMLANINKKLKSLIFSDKDIAISESEELFQQSEYFELDGQSRGENLKLLRTTKYKSLIREITETEDECTLVSQLIPTFDDLENNLKQLDYSIKNLSRLSDELNLRLNEENHDNEATTFNSQVVTPETIAIQNVVAEVTYTETADTETADTETADTETADTETADTETADTGNRDTGNTDTENTDTERTQADELLAEIHDNNNARDNAFDTLGEAFAKSIFLKMANNNQEIPYDIIVNSCFGSLEQLKNIVETGLDQNNKSYAAYTTLITAGEPSNNTEVNEYVKKLQNNIGDMKCLPTHQQNRINNAIAKQYLKDLQELSNEYVIELRTNLNTTFPNTDRNSDEYKQSELAKKYELVCELNQILIGNNATDNERSQAEYAKSTVHTFYQKIADNSENINILSFQDEENSLSTKFLRWSQLAIKDLIDWFEMGESNLSKVLNDSIIEENKKGKMAAVERKYFNQNAGICFFKQPAVEENDKPVSSNKKSGQYEENQDECVELYPYTALSGDLPSW